MYKRRKISFFRSENIYLHEFHGKATLNLSVYMGKEDLYRPGIEAVHGKFLRNSSPMIPERRNDSSASIPVNFRQEYNFIKSVITY